MAGCVPLPKGGYECEFVDTVPESLTCPVCLLPFRDPHLLDCCGAKYCAECIGRVKTAGQPCPICKQQFNSLLDKNDQRKILGLRVRCSKKHEGCEWEGELRCMDDHEKETCDWVSLECRYECGGRISRRRIAEHEENECPQRPMDVKMESLMKKMEQRHMAEIATVREEMEKKDQAYTADMNELKHSLKECLAMQESRIKQWVKEEVEFQQNTTESVLEHTGFSKMLPRSSSDSKHPKKIMRNRIAYDKNCLTSSDVLVQPTFDLVSQDLPTFGSVTRRVSKRTFCFTPGCSNYAKELDLCHSCLEKNQNS